MAVLLFLIRVLLACLFAVAGLAKLADAKGSRKSLADFGVPVPVVGPVSVFLPIAELICALALLWRNSIVWGATGMASLLVLFIAAIGINLAGGRTPECHCFGQLGLSRVSWKTLVRNVALLALAGLVIWNGTGIPMWPPLPKMSGLEDAMLVIEGLLAGLLALTVWLLFHMLKQNGRLLLRLEAVEKKLGIDPNTRPEPSLPLGDPAPPFRLADLDGGMVTLEMLREIGKPLLLIFAEPNCGLCEALQPEVALWQHEYADRITIVPVNGGKAELNRAKANKHGLQNVLLQRDREVAYAYRVTAAPCAVLVNDGKIASPLAEGADEIRALVFLSILPPPVKKGDAVPALLFPDLTGKNIDLASLRGRRTLLLFWNPSCGFCQQMLPDMKHWEQRRSPDESDLVIVSAGSLEANREQGFRSRVLLDPHFGVGRVFGVTGTPSAVVLDEHGNVASEVGIGATAVLALAEAISQTRR
jgi:thiol-disulfide isomerase/thioredoxin